MPLHAAAALRHDTAERGMLTAAVTAAHLKISIPGMNCFHAQLTSLVVVISETFTLTQSEPPHAHY